MPSSTRPTTPGPSSVPQGTKRAMSDAESVQQESKKPRRNSSPEPSTRHDSNRDNRRRRKRKKKVPIVNSGTAKNEATQSQLDGRSRAPLSARNEIIRFTSAPPDTDLPSSNTVPAANIPPQASSSNHLAKPRRGSSHTADNTSRHRSEVTPSTSRDNNNDVVPPERPVPEPPSSSLEDKVAQLEAELKSKNGLITSHHALLSQVQQSITCQVCLDLMYKPYALAPCGHLACHSCLVNWFTAPSPDNRPLPPPIMRKKTCPHCRAIVRERPVEVWGVKSIAQVIGKSGLLQNLLPLPEETSEASNSNVDPWKDIFPKLGAASHHRLPWYVSGADVDDDIADVAPRGEDVGMLDMEDGGIYRCLDCMHEIWDGVCTSCGRVYPGHRPEGDDEDDVGDPAGWFDDRMGAEEIDVADDPGWMGLEDGEADDGGDFDDWRPFDPWPYAYRGFLGTIHVDGEDDEDEGEDEEFSGVVELGLHEEGEEDDGYESSFIDDEDGGDGIAELLEAHRFYEDDDDDDDGYHPNVHPRIVELGSDEEDKDEDEDHDTRERGPVGGRGGHSRVDSPDEEANESEEDVAPPPRGLHRRSRAIESEGSDAGSW